MGLMKSLATSGRRTGRGKMGGAGAIDLKIDQRSYERLRKRLAKLPPQMESKVVGQAASSSMQPVVSAARRLAKKPGRSGLLAKSIGKKLVRYKANGTVLVIVGARRGFKDPATGEDPANIAHLIEFGTAPHDISGSPVLLIDGWFVRGTVRHPGSPPMPFIRPALDGNRTKVIAKYRSKIKSGLDREVAKLAKG